MKKWFQDRFGLKKRPTEAVPASSPAAIQVAIEAMKQELRSIAKPAVSLNIRLGEAVAPGATSSIGGRPSLAPEAAWPTDQDGVPMMFVAQLAFAQLPRVLGFPSSGPVSYTHLTLPTIYSV